MSPSKYKFGVEWIALNDDPGSSDAYNPESLKGLVSIALLADLSEKNPLTVARDVARYRKNGNSWIPSTRKL